MKNMAIMGFIAGSVLGVAIGMTIDDGAVNKHIKHGRHVAKRTVRRLRSMM